MNGVRIGRRRTGNDPRRTLPLRVIEETKRNNLAQDPSDFVVNVVKRKLPRLDSRQQVGRGHLREYATRLIEVHAG